MTAAPRGDLLRDSRVERVGAGRYSGSIPDAWRMFHAHGGMTFAVALRAIETEISAPEFRPLSASALFVSPVQCGPVEVSVAMLRRGKSAALATAELRMPGAERPSVCVQAAFGLAKPGAVSLDRTSFPEDLASRSVCRPYVGIGADLPINQQCEWVQQPEVEPPGGGRLLSWVRYHVPPRLPDGRIDPVTQTLNADNLVLAIMAGLPPNSPLLNLLTFHMEMEFFDQTHHDWTIQVIRALRVGHGYAHGSVELWDEDRKLLARASQRALCTAFPGA
jgi:acyl-CoA thioesterase